MSRVTFSWLPAGRHDVLRLALESVRLTADDLDLPGRAFFELSDDQGPIGFVGIEGAGADRLLRSLVVLPSRKQKGHGGLLVAHVEATARQGGVERVHLLTATVVEFFLARGYRAADRATAPDAIRSTLQFSSSCPGTATYLGSRLISTKR